MVNRASFFRIANPIARPPRSLTNGGHFSSGKLKATKVLRAGGTSCVFPHPSPYDWELRVYNSANPNQELACNPSTNRWEIGTPITPPVTLEASGRAWRVEGTSCLAPLLAGTDTNVSVFSSAAPTEKMTCYPSYPYANQWRVVPPLVGGCYLGMPQANIPYECALGGNVAASANDGTVIGKYIGLGTGGKHLVADLTDVAYHRDWRFYGYPTQVYIGDEYNYPTKYSARVAAGWRLPQPGGDLEALYSRRYSLGLDASPNGPMSFYISSEMGGTWVHSVCTGCAAITFTNISLSGDMYSNIYYSTSYRLNLRMVRNF